MSEHDDSAEVVAISRVIAASLVHHPDDTRAAARAVLADRRERGWRSPADVAELLRDALLAQRAEIEETHILVPRDGAEVDEEWGEQDSEWPGMRRTVVYGPWQVAE